MFNEFICVYVSVKVWELVEINRPERIAARGESEFSLEPLTMTWDEPFLPSCI